MSAPASVRVEAILRRAHRRLAAAIVLLATSLPPSACATAARGPGDDDVDRIVRAEIARLPGGSSAWSAIQMLRPEFLRVRAPATPTTGAPPAPLVVIDGFADEITTLRLLPAADVATIRHLSAPEATLRYGTGAAGGAILVTTHH